MSASTSTCSATCRAPAGSSKNGGPTTTPTGRIRALAATHQTSLQPGPAGAKTSTESSYERGQSGGNVSPAITIEDRAGFYTRAIGNCNLDDGPTDGSPSAGYFRYWGIVG